MAYTTPRWVRAWLAFSTVIVLWDAGYCLMRPRSMVGGDLSWIWAPYNLVPYSDVDWLYGWPAIESGDGFTNAQSLLNIVEAALNVLCVLLGDQPAGPVLGLISSIMTSSKTVLYFLQEYLCGWCMVGHNSRWRFWNVWVATNGTWIVVPTIVSLVLTAGIIRALTRAAPRKRSAAVAVARTAPAPLDEKAAFPQPFGGAPLPITFHIKGQTALVIGSNRLAVSRVFTLLDAEAEVVLASSKALSQLPEELQWRVQQGQISFKQAAGDWSSFLQESGAALVVATDTLIGSGSTDLATAKAIYAAAKAARIPVNVSDQPTLSTFTFPSVHRFAGAEGPSNLQIAVSTNGQGCRLAGRIRREIATKLPSSVGAAVDNIGTLRSRAKASLSDDDEATPLNRPVAQGADDPLRRMRWVHQMSEYYSFDRLATLSSSELDAALESGEAQFSLPHHEVSAKGRILLVGSGPGHPGLLTVAARHALDNATLILSDKLVPAEIIALIPKRTKLIIARKFPGNADGAQNELMELALQGARAGETVVRLKQGDPFVYGRGGEEVLEFRKHGFEPVVVPGVSSALAGPLMLGIPVTQRGVADSFVMCTGVGRAGAHVSLPGYVKARTLAILMGVARIEQMLSVLLDEETEYRDGAAFPLHLPIAIVERASSPDQRVLLSTLEHIEEGIRSLDQRPPGMILVGWAAMCLEGEGRVDILDGVDEREAVAGWLGGKRWKTREGLPEDWAWFGSSEAQIEEIK